MVNGRSRRPHLCDIMDQSEPYRNATPPTEASLLLIHSMFIGPVWIFDSSIVVCHRKNTGLTSLDARPVVLRDRPGE